MSGKRILDAIALLRVSRNVAVDHFAIRASQLELYGKTSSLAKALRQQPLTASSFSSRSGSSLRKNDDLIPHADKVSGAKTQEEGIKQDHFYTRADENAASSSPPRESQTVTQSKADRYPLPDGTIPPANSPISEDVGDPESEYRRPKVDVAQEPLEGEAKQSLQPESSSRSTIPDPNAKPLSPDEARKAQRQAESQIPARSAEPPSSDNEPEFSVDQEKDVYYQPPGQTKPVLSALPRMRVPKVENDIQGGDPHIPKDINADVFYSGAKEKEVSEPSEEQLEQLFHSPRSAKLLGKKSKYLPGGSARQFHTTRAVLQSDSEKEDLKKLAADMAKDVSSNIQAFRDRD